MASSAEAVVRRGGEIGKGEAVANLVIGGLLNHLLVTGRSPSAADSKQVVDILLEGLRRG